MNDNGYTKAAAESHLQKCAKLRDWANCSSIGQDEYIFMIVSALIGEGLLSVENAKDADLIMRYLPASSAALHGKLKSLGIRTAEKEKTALVDIYANFGKA